MITIRSPLKKTLLLITLTTLTIGLGTAAEFNLPEGDVHDNDVFLAADNFDNSDSINYVQIEYEDPNGNTGTYEMTEESNSGNYTYTFDKDDDADGTQGEYELTAVGYDSSDNEVDSTGTRDIILDASGPDVEQSDDGEYVEDDPELTFEVSDDYSEVQDVSASITDGDAEIDGDDTEDANCDAGDTCEVEFDVDTSDLDQGDDFDIEVTAEDEVGNSGSTEPTFTLDDEWDGDDSASVEWDESSSYVLTGFSNEDQDLVVSLDEGDSVSETTVTCEVDGDEVDSSSEDMTDGETDEFFCEIDSIRSGSRFDLSVTAEDEAGNSQTLVDEEQMIWDTDAPSIDNLEQPEGVSTFNSEFSLNTLVSDDASGIETMEYYFDANTEVGDGTSISLDNAGAETVEMEFTVSPGDLGQGSQTVYVRAEDGTGQTAVESFDFEYFPDRNPSVNLGAPDSVEVTSGESTEFTLSIENGAPFFLNGVEVSGSGAVWNGTVTATNLEEGDSVEKVITVDASNVEVGEYDLVLETSDTGDSASVNVIVRATESQKETIDSNLQDWQDRRSELEENISRIGTLETDNENITGFTEKLDNAESAIEDGNYYQAKSYLEEIDSSYSQASETFKEKEQQHQINQRNKLFMLLFGGIVLLGGGAFGFLFYRDGEMDLESLEDIEVPSEVPDIQDLGVVDRVKELLNSAEEEVEEETNHGFDGFN